MKSAFLEELFPDPLRSRKGRVARISEANARTYRPLGSFQRAKGVVSKLPEVMLKIGSASIKSYRHLMKAADYIARHGKLEIENQDGFMLTDKSDYRLELYTWKLESALGDGEEESRYGEARRLILSMPVGTPASKFKEACHAWASSMLDGYDYLMGFHIPGEDEKTGQPHCHILLRTLGKDGKRFHVSNAERDALREYFAACCLEAGIDANSTRRWSRGVIQKGLKSPEFHAAKEVAETMEETKTRNRAHAIARKKRQKLLKTQEAKLERISEAKKTSSQVPLHPAAVKAKKNRKTAVTLANAAAKELSSSESREEKLLGENLRKHFSTLGPAETKEEEALRQLREKEHQKIKRMQAMRKRIGGKGR